MALVSDSLTSGIGVNSVLARVQRWASSYFAPADHYSPEGDLWRAQLRDSRLAPRAEMSNAQIDVGLLSQLSQIGLKRAKLVTEQSHPELMQGWKIMAQRAGLKAAPQLIIAESDSLNALTVTKDEVTITTGLLRKLDLRETLAVLGHELGHVQSDHIGPRVTAMGILGGTGAMLGNEFGRAGGLNMALQKLGNKFPFFQKVQNRFYGAQNIGKPSSWLGNLIYIALGVQAGVVMANKLTVRPTELDADAKGARISGDPEGLARGLQVLQDNYPKPSLQFRWKLFSSGYPATSHRIANLRAMPPQGVPVINLIGPQQAAAEPAPAEPVVQAQPGASVHTVSAERVSPAIAEPALT